MHLRRLSLGVLIALLTSLTPLSFKFTAPLTVLQVLAQTPDARKVEADRLLDQGTQQLDTSQFEAAKQSFQQALTIYREINDRKGEGWALGNLGIAYKSLGDYAQAIDYEKQSLAIAREIHDRQNEGKALGNLGIAYRNLGDYAQAIDYEKQWLAIAQQIHDRQSEGKALGNLGNAYINLGNYAQAIDYEKQLLAIAQQIHDRQSEGKALGNLGIAYHSLGDYAQAIDYEKQYLAIARAIKDRLGEETALGNLGNAYFSLGDYTKAIEYQQQRLAIARQIKDRLGEGAALGNLGVAYFFLGDYAKAIEYHQHSLAIARQIKDRQGEGAALGNLGNAYFSLGDYAKAIEYQQQHLAIAREIKDRSGEGASLGNLGVAYNSLGDYAKAIDYQQQCLAIARQIKDRLGEGQSLGNLGGAYFSLGDYAKAIEYQQQHLAIARQIKDRLGEGQSLGNLGLAYDSLGDYAKAIDYQQQSLAIARQIKDRQGEGNALGNLGNAYHKLGDYAKAIEYQQQYLAIAREIGDKDGEGLALNNLGATLQKSGNLTQAETTLRAGIETWESQRERLGNNDAYKVSIFEEQARTYRTLQQVLIAQNNPNAALLIAERGRARAFVELLRRRKATTSDSGNSPITPPTIEQLQQIAKEHSATLVEYSIIYDDFKIKGKEESHESELYIWVISPTGVVTFRSSDLKPLWQKQNTTLADLVFTSRDSLGVRDTPIIGIVPRPGFQQKQEASLTEQLQQLHKLLIEPIADLLPTDSNARVVFIPQSSLFLVPFGALQGKDGKYLIEKHTILTAPSIQVLQLTREQRQLVGAKSQSPLQGNDALVVGNPTMPSVPPKPGEKPQQLPSLPGAETEAKAIAEVLHTQPLIGSEATKSTVEQLMSKARFIHLATHGLLDDVRGLGSAIALAPDSSYKEEIGKVNGLLTAEEILDLKLNAELVVLSACNTGRGKITGDGVIGLSRSLISAGVPSVLVSLWSVPDAPTAQLMTEFYQNLQKNPDKAQALRQAMLTILKQHPNPKNWAAFTLIGESN
ncbi:MAG TPA: CHAT domain-containing tetratricopeptide repeat protein [Waterburya sp.]|jgi:CHAT domain-containing protein